MQIINKLDPNVLKWGLVISQTAWMVCVWSLLLNVSQGFEFVKWMAAFPSFVFTIGVLFSRHEWVVSLVKTLYNIGLAICVLFFGAILSGMFTGLKEGMFASVMVWILINLPVFGFMAGWLYCYLRYVDKMKLVHTLSFFKNN